MKKLLLTILCALFGLSVTAQNEKVYTEQLLVTINGETSEPQMTDVTVIDNVDGTIDFELKNFILVAGEDSTPVGNIVIEDIATEEGADGLTHFAYTGNISIQAGDLEGVDMWYGPMLPPIPVVLQGKLNEEKLYVTIDIDMTSTMQQMIYVQLGTDDFFTKVYTEPLLVTVNGETSAPQDASVSVTDNGNGTIKFELKNFVLGSGEEAFYVGNIVINDIATEEGTDGLTHFAYTGNISIQAGDLEGVDMWYGPMLPPIPVVLQGKLNEEKLYVTIDIDMTSTMQQMIYVQLGTDDFVAAIPGDLNGDGSVDISDAVAVLDIMAASTDNLEADFNGDGSVDISDFVAVLDLMAQQ